MSIDFLLFKTSLEKGMSFFYNINMKNLTFIQPYSDDVLKWNAKTNKYELTIEFVKKELDIHFYDDGVLEKRLTKNTRKIYNYIKYHSYSGNSHLIDVLLSKTQEGRDFIKDVLFEQFDADNETGFNDLSSQPAINFANGQVLDRDELRRNQISVDAEQIIDRSTDYFGFNIFFMGRFPEYIQLLLARR